GVDALELGHAGVGRPPDRGADLAGHHVPLRCDGAAAAALGDGALRPGVLAVVVGALLVIGIPSLVAAQAGDATAGKTVYELKCMGCHGDKGDGKGAAAELLMPRPRDFTSGLYKIRTTANNVPTDQDLFRILIDGMPGTSMPSWAVLPDKDRWNLVAYIKAFAADKFKEAPKQLEKPEDIWHLTNFILSLGPDSPHYATLVGVTAVSDVIPDDPNADFWKKLTSNNIPLMGQVIVDPRNFNPAIDLVSVRAVYNDREIGFHLTWDDATQSADEPAKKLYADAISLQFPPQSAAGLERPYFLMGDGSDPVYLLRWENGKGVSEATANGPTKIVPLAGAEATGKAVYT